MPITYFVIGIFCFLLEVYLFYLFFYFQFLSQMFNKMFKFRSTPNAELSVLDIYMSI